MNDNDIIKALECCQVHPMKCKECPYMGVECCTNAHRKDALDLINRQKTEIESYKKGLGITHLYGDVEVHTKTLDDYYKFKNGVKAEAIKEFEIVLTKQKEMIDSYQTALESMRCVAKAFQTAHERADGKRKTAIQDFADSLKEIVPNYIGYDNSHLHKTIDNLVKEMIGGV